MTKRREKKSESLEIRLPYSQKQAFMEACRERGVTASDVLRSFIADELEPAEVSPGEANLVETARNNPLKTAAGGISAVLAAATFGTGVGFAEDSTFERFDTNRDGIVSYGEFTDSLSGSGDEGALDQVQRRIEIETDGGAVPTPPEPTQHHRDLFKNLDADHSESLTPEELETEGSFTKRTDQIIERTGVRTRIVGLEIYNYDLSPEGTSQVAIEALSRAVDVDAPAEEIDAVLEGLRQDIERMRAERPVPPVPPAN